MTNDKALDLALEALEKSIAITMANIDLRNKAITAIKQARALNKKAENAGELGLDYEPVLDVSLIDEGKTAAPVQEPVGGTQVSKVWWDGENLMAKPIPLEDIYLPAPVQSCYCPNCEEMGKELAALKSQPAPVQEPRYTTGHCKEKAQPGGCQLHNLHCGYPACDRKAANTLPAAQQEHEPENEPHVSLASVQEPYGYVWFTKHMEHRFTRMKPHPDMGAMDIRLVYTTPPAQPAPAPGYCKHCKQYSIEEPLPAAQRQWVGLTDDERSECVNTPFVSQQWANIEAKLKEKNT
jgi:hypothetical protein